MGVRTGAYATIWEVKPNGNFTDVRLSTSRKNRQTDEYEQDFGGYVRFIATAHQMAANLKERDRIKIGDCEITNRYVKEKNQTYTNIAIYSFEMADNSNNNSQPTQAKKPAEKFQNIPDGIDEELPFN